MTEYENTKLIPLTQGKFAIVDAEDFEWLSQLGWYYNNGYAVRVPYIDGIRGKTTYMHREIMGTPKGRDTDHINSDSLDNRRSNLRIVTTSQNMMNQRKTRGTSKYKGVCWYRAGNKWMAYINLNGKRKYLGFFHTEDDAANAYNLAAMALHGEYARLNVIK